MRSKRRMALRNASQLDEMERFAQIHLHIPSDAEGHRHHVLRFFGVFLRYLAVRLYRLVHGVAVFLMESCIDDFLRRHIAVDDRKVLALLGQDPVALEVAVDAEIREDVKRIIDVLQCPARMILRHSSVDMAFIFALSWSSDSFVQGYSMAANAVASSLS